MNANGLARHYGKLKPLERLSLVLAAEARGDEAEADRLAATAPKANYSAPDHYELDQTFVKMAARSFLEVADLAATFWECLFVADSVDLEDDERIQNYEAARAVGFLIKAHLAGWRRFCAENNLEAEFHWSGWPGYDRIRQAENVAERVALGLEGMVRLHGAKLKEGGRLPTAESIAVSLQRCWDDGIN